MCAAQEDEKEETSKVSFNLILMVKNENFPG